MFRSFFDYIKDPFIPDQPHRFRLTVLIKYLLLYLLLALTPVSFLALFEAGGLFEHALDDVSLNAWNVWMIVLLGPLIEELVFRLNLKVTYINTMVLLILLFMGSFILLENKILQVILLLIIFSAMVWICRGGETAISSINRFYSRHFRWVFYFSCFAFALLHVGNFDGLNDWAYLLAPVLVLPQLIMGFILGFIRMKYSFLAGVILHVTVNSLCTLPELL